MGYPYNELVAPAILHMNPGITREEFVALLDQTHSYMYVQFDEDDPWDGASKREFEDKDYHSGFGGLADILGLGFTEAYNGMLEPKVDENGFLIKPPYVLYDNETGKHIVVATGRVVLGDPKAITQQSWDKLKPGDVWEETQVGDEIGIVVEIMGERKLHDDNNSSGSGPMYEYHMVIRPIERDYAEHEFGSEEDLCKEWPQFHPDFKYSWSQERGAFKTGTNDFTWIKKDGRYYLDPETFDMISASLFEGGLGYRDLILTEEAIKKGAWKLLSRRGLDHLRQFFRDFPDILDAYNAASWDADTSIYAKNTGMTNTELMRARLTGFRWIE